MPQNKSCEVSIEHKSKGTKGQFFHELSHSIVKKNNQKQTKVVANEILKKQFEMSLND